MTNAEFIQEVRTEIENRLKECSEDTQFEGERCIYKRILSFISDLEKSLPSKVVDAKWLENEIVNYSFNSVPNLSPPLMITADFARHFYELGCRHTAEKYDESEKPMNLEGLEKEIEEYFPESTFNTGFNYDDLQEIARHFAQWGAEHLKK